MDHKTGGTKKAAKEAAKHMWPGDMTKKDRKDMDAVNRQFNALKNALKAKKNAREESKQKAPEDSKTSKAKDTAMVPQKAKQEKKTGAADDSAPAPHKTN